MDLNSLTTSRGSEKLEKLPVLSIFKKTDLQRWHVTSTLLTIGFPSSINRLDKRKPRSSINNTLQYFCDEFDLDEINDRIEIAYDTVNTRKHRTKLEKLPHPEGLSGSPVLMLMYGESVASFTLALRVVGVAMAWQPEQAKLVVRQIGDPLVSPRV